jgi:hypothetical protein
MLTANQHFRVRMVPKDVIGAVVAESLVNLCGRYSSAARSRYQLSPPSRPSMPSTYVLAQYDLEPKGDGGSGSLARVPRVCVGFVLFFTALGVLAGVLGGVSFFVTPAGLRGSSWCSQLSRGLPGARSRLLLRRGFLVVVVAAALLAAAFLGGMM